MIFCSYHKISWKKNTKSYSPNFADSHQILMSNQIFLRSIQKPRLIEYNFSIILSRMGVPNYTSKKNNLELIMNLSDFFFKMPSTWLMCEKIKSHYWKHCFKLSQFQFCKRKIFPTAKKIMKFQALGKF